MQIVELLHILFITDFPVDVAYVGEYADVVQWFCGLRTKRRYYTLTYRQQLTWARDSDARRAWRLIFADCIMQ
jgi:homoserine acetyltransferase